jgi:SAM-dependent methyltransferase
MKIERLASEGVSTAAPAFAPAPELEFTGERIVPGGTGEVLFRQHEERYVFAAQYVFGRDVLDVACGTGVGTSYLRQMGARKVWGLDIDRDAVAFAKARYTNCEFAESDAINMCMPDDSVDVVVSFETLEHLKDQRKFLMECRRVLKPRGVLICSTPNQTLSRWGPTNPYHLRELTTREFQELLASMFSGVQLFGQECRIYPLYVARKLILKVLDRLHLTAPVDRMLRPKKRAAALYRTEFSGEPNSLNGHIQAHPATILIQPMFVIGVGCNSRD